MDADAFCKAAHSGPVYSDRTTPSSGSSSTSRRGSPETTRHPPLR
jgi:hypothetical protein